MEKDHQTRAALARNQPVLPEQIIEKFLKSTSVYIVHCTMYIVHWTQFTVYVYSVQAVQPGVCEVRWDYGPF